MGIARRAAAAALAFFCAVASGADASEPGLGGAPATAALGEAAWDGAAWDAATAAEAAPLWPDEPFAYVVLRQDLRRYLRSFARWADVFLNLDRDVQGVVEGPLPPMAAETLLDALAADHGFYWWHDGAVLHIGPSDDLVSESEPIAPERAEATRAALRRLGLVEPRFPVRIDARAGFISATGPDDYVRRILAVARGAASDPLSPAPGDAFRRVTIYRAGDASAVRVVRRFGPMSDAAPAPRGAGRVR